MVEMFTVWARSPPVPTTSTASARSRAASTRVGVRRASPRPGRRSRPGSRPWRAARPRSRRSAAAVALPAMISPIAQAVSAVESSSPRSSAASRCGQVRSPTARRRRVSGRRWTQRRARHSGGAVAQQAGDGLPGGDRVERVGQRGVDLGVGGQPAVGGPGDHHAGRRAVVDLVLELAGDAQAAGRRGLAVEHQQVDVVVVDQPDAPRRSVDASTNLTCRSAAGRVPMASRIRVADLRVVAVEQDGATCSSARRLLVLKSSISLAASSRRVAPIVPSRRCGAAASSPVQRAVDPPGLPLGLAHPLHDQHARAW